MGLLIAVSDRLFHRGELSIRQKIEMCRSFSGRKAAVVLKAKLNKQINQAVRHINDILNRLFRAINPGIPFQHHSKAVLQTMLVGIPPQASFHNSPPLVDKAPLSTRKRVLVPIHARESILPAWLYVGDKSLKRGIELIPTGIWSE